MMRTILSVALFLVAVSGAAFVPQTSRTKAVGPVQMKFLKDLGFDKPSWLPDFGEKKEEAAAPEATTDEESTEEAKEDAPKEE
jgi:hypothetical protein